MRGEHAASMCWSSKFQGQIIIKQIWKSVLQLLKTRVHNFCKKKRKTPNSTEKTHTYLIFTLILVVFKLFQLFLLDAPLFPPNISAGMSFPVNERQLIILRCTLSSLANPIVLWRWVCGDDNLTKNATNTATVSTLTFTADKKYHERKCQCWAMSTHISLAYNKSSDAMVITVFCKV